MPYDVNSPEMHLQKLRKSFSEVSYATDNTIVLSEFSEQTLRIQTFSPQENSLEIDPYIFSVESIKDFTLDIAFAMPSNISFLVS